MVKITIPPRKTLPLQQPQEATIRVKGRVYKEHKTLEQALAYWEMQHAECVRRYSAISAVKAALILSHMK